MENILHEMRSVICLYSGPSFGFGGNRSRLAGGGTGGNTRETSSILKYNPTA
jgi:hypothetical protein